RGAQGTDRSRESRRRPRRDLHRDAAGGVAYRARRGASFPTNIARPAACVSTTTAEIFSANDSRLSTCTIGRIERTTKASVIRNPDSAAPFIHHGDGTANIGSANITR